jgi:hypothetical protein
VRIVSPFRRHLSIFTLHRWVGGGGGKSTRFPVMFLLLFCFLHTFHLGRHGHSYAHIIISLPMRHWVRWDHIICSCILHGRGRRSRRRSRERSGTAKGKLKRRKERRAFAIFCCFCALFCCSVFFIDAPEKEGKERKERRGGKEGADWIVVVVRPLTPFLFFVLSSKWHTPLRARSARFGMRVAGWGCGPRAHRVRLFYFYGIKTLRLCVSFFFVACLVM